MHSTLRQHLRNALDAHARRRRQAFIDAGELHVCSRCGTDDDLTTPGCKTCWNRARERERRSDPEYRTQAMVWQKQRRARAREAA